MLGFSRCEFAHGQVNLCDIMPDWMCYKGQVIPIIDNPTQWAITNCPGLEIDDAMQLLAMARLYFETGNSFGEGSLHEAGWLSTCEPCVGWNGVFCEDGDGRVTRILLQSKSPPLSGTLPTTLSHLTKLRDLTLFNNDLTGSLPTEIGLMHALTGLNIRRNRFSGTLPDSLGDLTSLIDLALSNNNFIGTLPTTLSNLYKAREIALYSNFFSGIVPSALGVLSDLDFLLLHNNSLTGSMPQEICESQSNGKILELSADCGGDNPNLLCSYPDCCTTCY